ncbi:MAG: cob(I)yrinic acid a,c-diamide adenosyltransferase [Opitutaceae bacterium]|jgi:cob(I)alamin adenosyltransferase
MASISTRKGDEGLTGLLYGQRVPKNHPQIEAVGAFDELNSALGFAKATCPDAARKEEIERIQQELVSLMGEIVCAESDAARHAGSKFRKIDEAALARIDEGVAAHEARNLRFDGWATPGANLHASALDMARSISRRAERHLTGLASHGRIVRPVVRQYVNRLCDLLWLMARAAEQEAAP